jgi:hypothetical protein
MLYKTHVRIHLDSIRGNLQHPRLLAVLTGGEPE